MSIDADKHLRSPTTPRQPEEATANNSSTGIGSSVISSPPTAAQLDAVAAADNGITSMTVNQPTQQLYPMAQQQQQQPQDGNAGPEVASSDLGNLEGHVRNLILHNQDQPSGTDTPPQMHANLPIHGPPPMGMGMPPQPGYEQHHHSHMPMSPHPPQMPPPFMYQQIQFGNMPPPTPMHGYPPPPPHFYPHHFPFEGYPEQHFGVHFSQYPPGPPPFSPDHLQHSHPSSPALAGYPPPPIPPPPMPMHMSAQGVMPLEANGYGPPPMEAQVKAQGTPLVSSPGSASPANSQRGLADGGARSHPRSRPVSQYANGTGRTMTVPPPLMDNGHFPPLGSQRTNKGAWGQQPSPQLPPNQHHVRQFSRSNYRQQNHTPRPPAVPLEDQLRIINEVAEKHIALATPSDEEIKLRTQLREDLQVICRKVSPTAVLELFGSVASGFATVNSDLDLIYCEKDGAPDLIETPKKLADELDQAGYNVLLLAKTRVPIIKVNNAGEGIVREETTDPKKSIAVDIGFGQHSDLAFCNTHLLQTYSKCDPRVKQMVLFVKWWSKVRKINNTYRGTLSSYGYVLMIIHYLINIVHPPVLPNLQDWEVPEGTPESETKHRDGWAIWYWKDQKMIEECVAQGQMTTNKMDIGSLLRGFFEYYGKTFDWNSDVISIRTKGGILTKVAKEWKTAINRVNKADSEYKDRYLFAIEDPFEITHNISRTCSGPGVKRMRTEFWRAYRLLHFFNNGEQEFRDQFFEEATDEWRPYPRYDNNQHPRGGYHGGRQHRGYSQGNNAYNGNVDVPPQNFPQQRFDPQQQQQQQQQPEFHLQQPPFPPHLPTPVLQQMPQGPPPHNGQPFIPHPQFVPGTVPPTMNPTHQEHSVRPPMQAQPQQPLQAPPQAATPAPQQAVPTSAQPKRNRPLVLVGSTALERMS